MPKRARGGDQLTGGTGDVNPQWLTIRSNAVLGTSFTTTAVPTPINKFPEGSGRVVIMEILKCFFYPGQLIGANSDDNLQMYLTTKNFSTTVPSLAQAEPSIIAAIVYSLGASASGATNLIQPITVDLTDGAGHGMLVATDNIYLGQIQSAAAEPFNATVTSVKILYRFKKVSLQEYIGIVQSQQS